MNAQRLRLARSMNVTFRFRFLMVCLCCIFGAGLGQRLFADETNSAMVSQQPATDKASQDSLNALLQIQDQLHAMQLLIQSNRVATTTEAKQDTADMSARIQALEETISAQRNTEIETAQKAQRLTLVLAGGFGLLTLTALLLMAYFQWRAVTRLVELSTLHASAAAALEGRAASPLLSGAEVHVTAGRTAVQLSSTRLFNVVDRLEKRILELEHTAQAPLTDTAPPYPNGHYGAPTVSADRDECIANLLVEGQLLLNRNEPEKALECFDQVLALVSKHSEALIKKAAAFEKLNRFDEALACYDAAIAADSSMTIAYLHKGGLFNRMSRYEEALQCYEHALHTHDKRASGERTAA